MAAVLVVRDGRHPIALLAMVACVIVGTLGLIGPRSPTSTIDRFIPDPWRYVYYALLMFAGLIVLLAACLPDIRDRVIWERIGLLFFCAVLFCYPAAAWAGHYQDPGVVYEGVTSFAFALGGFIRLIEISVYLSRAKRLVQQAGGRR